MRAYSLQAKYVRYVIVNAWEHPGAVLQILEELRRRPITKHPVCVMKACALLLKLWQQGPEDVAQKSLPFLNVLEALRNAWTPAGGLPASSHGSGYVGRRGSLHNRASPSMARFIVQYLGVIVDKLTFHRQFPAFSSIYRSTSDPNTRAEDGTPLSPLAGAGMRGLGGAAMAASTMMGILTSIVSAFTIAITETTVALVQPSASPSPAANDTPKQKRDGECLTVVGALPALLWEAWAAVQGAFEILDAYKDQGDQNTKDMVRQT